MALRKGILIVILLLGMGLVASQTGTSSPPAAHGSTPEPPPGLAAYLGVPQFDRPRWDPAGKRLAFLSQQRLYLLEPPSSPRPLARSLAVRAFFWTSDGEALICEAVERSLTRIYRLRVRDGLLEPLTPADRNCHHPVLQAGRLAYSDDESLQILRLSDRRVRKLYSGPGRLLPVRFSPDGTRLLAVAERSSLASDLLSIDLETGQARILAAGSRFVEPRWRGNRKVLALTDRDSNLLSLAELDLKNGQWSTLVSAPGEVESYAWREDGLLAYLVNQEGRSQLFLGGEPVSLPEAVVRNLAFRPDGQLAYWLSGPEQPGSAWLLDPETRKAQRVLGPSAAHLKLVSPRRVHYPGAGGLSIPSLVYAGPPGSPALVMLHGGPANQSRPEFHPLLQYLASQGYTLLLPDYRGSLGYGREFLAADDGPKRTLAVDDVVAAGTYLQARGHGRLALAGYSYGGFLALAALARAPEKFGGAVSLSGISDLSSFVQSVPGRSWTRREEFGDPELDKSVLEELSPLHQIPRFQRPLLIIHGDQDTRVPVQDALRFVAELKTAGASVEFVRLEREGHGLTREQGRRAGYEAMVDFLARVTAR